MPPLRNVVTSGIVPHAALDASTVLVMQGAHSLLHLRELSHLPKRSSDNFTCAVFCR